MYKKISSIAVLGASCLTMAGCLNTGTLGGLGGGAGNLPGNAAEYEANFQAFQTGQKGAPTSVPLVGSGAFVGATRLDITSASDPSQTGYALGDLRVQANFDAQTISGTATNFRGELNGTAVALGGTLDSASAAVPSTLSSTTVPITLPPGVPPIPGAPTSITTTAFAVNMGGDLTDPNGDSVGTVLLGIGGSFLGPIGGGQATGAFGPATVVVNQPATPGIIDIGGAGTFYLERE